MVTMAAPRQKTASTSRFCAQAKASSNGDHGSPLRTGAPGMMYTSTLSFHVVTLNLEQDHKRWYARRELVVDQLAALQPDVIAFNEICVPLQTGRWLQRRTCERLGIPSALVQSPKSMGLR